LDEVAPGLRLLGPEGRTEGVDLAQGQGGRLGVELAAFAQEGGLIVDVGGLEHVGPTLGGGAHQDGGLGQHKAALLQELMDAHHDLVTHPQDGDLAGRPQPEVAMVHQELYAVLFGRDGVLISNLEDLEIFYAQLVTARGPVVFSDLTPDDDAGLLGQLFGIGEDLFAYIILKDDALAEAGAVTQDDKLKLAAGAIVVDPTAEFYL